MRSWLGRELDIFLMSELLFDKCHTQASLAVCTILGLGLEWSFVKFPSNQELELELTYLQAPKLTKFADLRRQT